MSIISESPKKHMGGGKKELNYILSAALLGCLFFNVQASNAQDYGEGSHSEYYKANQETGFFEKSDAENADVTVKYDTQNDHNVNPNSSLSGAWLNLKQTEDHGGAVYIENVQNENLDITGVFAGNSVECNLTASKYGGAIALLKESVINNIKADFIANHVKNTMSDHNMGGAIAILEGSDVNTITGDFLGNYVDAITEKAYGGAIAIYERTSTGSHSESVINLIKGNFYENAVVSEGDDVFGGAIYNDGIINAIDGYFKGNYARVNSGSQYARGGAIYNSNHAQIGNIKGVFEANYVYSDESSDETRGAAIYNEGKIAEIQADFIKNESKTLDGNAEGGAIYNYDDSEIGTIKGNFIENSVISGSNSKGGAIYNRGSIGIDSEGNIIEGIEGNFVNNSIIITKGGDHSLKGGAIYNESSAVISSIKGKNGVVETTGGKIEVNGFYGNKISAVNGENSISGGAIYNNGNIGTIEADFENNTIVTTGTGKNHSYGGAIRNDGIIDKIKGNFKHNSIDAQDTKRSGLGGAIYTETDGLNEIEGMFNQNFVKTVGDIAEGGAIGIKDGKVTSIKANFEGNYAAAQGGHQAHGGAIALINGDIDYLEGNFIGNYADSEFEKAKGGAIYYNQDYDKMDPTKTLTIKNSNFINNYAKGDASEDNGGEGGAIWTVASLTILADDAESKFSGNYIQFGDDRKDYQAIYMKSADTTLTLKAVNNGSILFDDKINGEHHFNLIIDGDETSRVILNNDVNKANATLTGTTLQIGVTNEAELQSDVFKTSTIEVQSGFVDTADVKYVNYDFEKLTSNKEAEYGIDIAFDGKDGQSDTFSVGAGSKGVIELSNLVINTINGFTENAQDEQEYLIQIIKDQKEEGNLELSIDNLHHIKKAESNMDSRDILAREFEVGTKDTKNDSIKIAGWRDSLAAWAELDSEEEKVFILEGHDKQLLTRDAKLNGEKFTIKGSNNNNLDLNNKNLLEEINDDQNITLSDLRLSNADNIKNNGKMTLNTVKLEDTSRITNNKELTIQGATNINGTITSEAEKKGTLNFNSANTNITGKVENQNIVGSADSVINLYNRNEFTNNALDLNNTTLNLFDLGTDELHLTNLAVNNSTVNIDSVNVDLENLKMGRIVSDEYGKVVAPTVNIKDLNVLNDSKSKVTHVQFTDNFALAQGVKSGVTEAEGPIFKYLVSYSSTDSPTAYSSSGDKSEGGIFTFTRSDVNPAIMTSSVAQLAGGYASMIQSLEFAFEHADTFSALPQHIRQAKTDSNKYAIKETDTKLKAYANEFNSKGLWFKPYTSFESIPMKNGYDVDTVIYGSYIGGDSELVHLKNGWETVSSGYIGYTGSSQAYQGNHTYQNGIIGGVTQTLYKDNFYTAITASVGSSIGETTTKYGEEDFTMLMAGAASKTGYNFEFKNGKYIIQPTLLMAYTMINTFDYTNAAGVNIDAEPLHALQVHPYIKFVQNTESGWQPYLSAGFVYNVMGSTQIKADEFSLPSLSIKPYAEYGIGVQKLWNDKYTGYMQAMIRNGGRNGVAFTAGFRWALGDNEKIEKVHNQNDIKPVNNEVKTVKAEPKKANVVKKSDNKVKAAKSEKKHPLLNKISNFFSGNNSDVQPTGEKKVFKQLTSYEKQNIILNAN